MKSLIAMKSLIIIFIAWNAIVFFVYGFDKHQAKAGGWRVSEKTLMLLALLFGGIGAWFGMQGFRHKTKHKLFTIGVPVCVAINIAVLYYFAHINLIGWWMSGR